MGTDETAPSWQRDWPLAAAVEDTKVVLADRPLLAVVMVPFYWVLVVLPLTIAHAVGEVVR